jgi:DUF971 family protein
MSWPTALDVSADKKTLTISYDDGAVITVSAEYLRVESPSAEVQGHSADQKKTVPGKRNVTITGIEPVGNYAVRIRFSDGHDSGIFTWAYFRELSADETRRWSAYLEALAKAGLSRSSLRSG